MTSLRVCFIAHFHLPSGIAEAEEEALYTGALKPFILALSKTQHIQILLHISGVFFHWIETAHPEFFLLLDDLIRSRQIELLGGGFYEPLFPLLPQSDRIGQIEMLTTYLRKQFGKRPQGLWLPNFAWDPGLPGTLDACSMGYTFLEDEQFRDAGLEGDDLYKPCLTEDQGKMVTVFPVSSRLSRNIDTQDYAAAFREIARKKEGIPWVSVLLSQNQGFSNLNTGDFFAILSSCLDFAEFLAPGRSYKNLQHLDRVYFNGGLHGRNCRQTLLRYREANGLYAKMIFTSALVNQLRGDKARKKSAREELWKAQCQDSFGLSASGGIFKPEIRSSSYHALIEAERTTRERGVFTPSIAALDFDFDGCNEYLFQDERINCYVSCLGASVFEFDFLHRAFNYCDTVNTPQLFADLFIKGEEQRDCGREWFNPFDAPQKGQKLRMGFRLEASEHGSNGLLDALRLEKIFSLRKDLLTVSYRISNTSSQEVKFGFIPRQAMSFPSDKPINLRIYVVSGDAKTLVDSADYKVDGGVNALEAQDVKNELIITLASPKPFALHLQRCSFLPPGCPEQKERLYAASLALPCFSIKLAAGESWENELNLRLTY